MELCSKFVHPLVLTSISLPADSKLAQQPAQRGRSAPALVHDGAGRAAHPAGALRPVVEAGLRDLHVPQAGPGEAGGVVVVLVVGAGRAPRNVRQRRGD